MLSFEGVLDRPACLTATVVVVIVLFDAVAEDLGSAKGAFR
jgi:hypothetical protein